MSTVKSWLASLLLALGTAACGPAADSVSSAQAQPPAAAVSYPAVEESAGDGLVFEYY